MRANADSNWRLDSDATKFVHQPAAAPPGPGLERQLLQDRRVGHRPHRRDRAPWVPASSCSGATRPPTRSCSSRTCRPTSCSRRGCKANTLVLGARTITQLKNHPDIIDRIKYTQKGIVTTDLIASLFDVEKILVSYATVTDVAELNDAKAQDAAATYGFMTNSKSALLCYTPSSPVPDDARRAATPSPGTATWPATASGSG